MERIVNVTAEFRIISAQSILRGWSADQPAEAYHVERILLIEVLMREAGM